MWKPPPFDMQAHLASRAQKEGQQSLPKEESIQHARPQKGPFWLRFHVWFWIAAVLYWQLSRAGIAFSVLPPSDGTVAGNVFGLFVPLGPNNLPFFLIGPLGWFALTLLFLFVWRADRYLQQFNPSSHEKVFYNVVGLGFLTFLMDFLTLGHWASLSVLLQTFK